MKSALRYAMFSLLMCVPAHAYEIETGSIEAIFEDSCLPSPVAQTKV